MDPAAFEVRRTAGAAGEIAFAHAGAGGRPLLLIHGWPETKRIWWRNIGPLAAAGFEVIAPDLRGFGDSDLAADDRYDVAAHSADMVALLDALGHDAAAVAAGDLGGVVGQDLSLRHPGRVRSLILFNTIAPVVPDLWEAAGLGPPRSRVTRATADYFRRQCKDADGLAAELDSPRRRRDYVAQMYGPRLWAAPGAFEPEDVDFMTEPFGDAARFRASIANYEYAGGPRTAPEPARLAEPNPASALVLYGPEDHVIPSDFPARMEAAFPAIVGPLEVPGAGHFVMWERARVFNSVVAAFCR